MLINRNYGIALSLVVIVGGGAVSAMKVVEAPSGKDAKAEATSHRTTVTSEDEKKVAAVADKEREKFQRTVALYQAIFEGDFKQVQALLFYPVYVNGTKELGMWTKDKKYYWSTEAFEKQSKTASDFVWLGTPLNVAIRCALSCAKDPSKTEDYYKIILLLVQQKEISFETFLTFEGQTTLPLILVMNKRAWPIAELLIDHGAKPESLDFEGKCAASDAALVKEFAQWKLRMTRAKYKKRSTSCLY